MDDIFFKKCFRQFRKLFSAFYLLPTCRINCIVHVPIGRLDIFHMNTFVLWGISFQLFVWRKAADNGGDARCQWESLL